MFGLYSAKYWVIGKLYIQSCVRAERKKITVENVLTVISSITITRITIRKIVTIDQSVEWLLNISAARALF